MTSASPQLLYRGTTLALHLLVRASLAETTRLCSQWKYVQVCKTVSQLPVSLALLSTKNRDAHLLGHTEAIQPLDKKHTKH